MTVYYVDPAAGFNGTGTQISPLNTFIGLVTTTNDTILIKSGSVVTETMQYCLNAQGLTIGMYGTGNKPIFDGSIILNNSKAQSVSGYSGIYAWAFQFGGTVVSPSAVVNGVMNIRQSTTTTQTVLASNVTYCPTEARVTSYDCDLGMVEENNVPMRWIPWNTDLYTTVNSAGNLTSHTNSPDKFDTPGRFTVDPINHILYIIPTNGTLIGNQYNASVRQYGVYSAYISSNSRLLTMEDLSIMRVSTNGVTFQYRSEIFINRLDLSRLGGRYQTGVYVGNGIELSIGTDDSVVQNCTSSDVLDSPFTSQLYDNIGASVRRHDWNNLTTIRSGMSCLEISINSFKLTGNTYYGAACIESVSANGLNHDNGTPGWSYGRGNSCVLVINNASTGSRISNLRVSNVVAKSNGTGSMINTQRTNAVNTFSNFVGQGYANRATTSYSTNPQSDIFCKVTAQGAPDTQLAGPTITDVGIVV